MKTSKTVQNPTAEAEVYREFMRLEPARRRRIAVRILRNQKMLGDLYDHVLIQRSFDEPGESIAWASYKRGNGAKT